MYLFRKFQDMQFGGTKDVDFTSINEYCQKTYFMPGIDPAKRFYLVDNYLDYLKMVRQRAWPLRAMLISLIR